MNNHAIFSLLISKDQIFLVLYCELESLHYKDNSWETHQDLELLLSQMLMALISFLFSLKKQEKLIIFALNSKNYLKSNSLSNIIKIIEI